jgi:UDP-glucose 4-epimerase
MDATGASSEVVVRWLAAAERGVPPQIHGTGTATLDLVYVTDAARANLLALRAGRGDAVCNVGSGVETSLLDLWKMIQRVVGGTRVAPEFLPSRPRPGVSRRLADVRRARDELGFTAEVPLQEGLRRLAAWWRESQVLDELAL